MKKTIREKRKLVLGSKKISSQIIRDIATVIDNVVAEAEKNNEDYLVLYSIESANDDSSYESESSSIFESGGFIDKKTIKKVNMSFTSFKQIKKIEIQLLHSIENVDSENYIWVSGDDTIWVNGILKKIDGIISDAEPQIRHNWIILTPLVCLLILANYCYYDLMFEKYKIEFTYVIPGLVALFAVPIASLSLLNYTDNYLRATYPNIELQTGPEYFQIPRKRRNKIAFIFSAVIIPIILEVVFYYSLGMN